MKMFEGRAYLTAAEMADVDRSAIESMGMDVMSLMENAGARTAELARAMAGGASGRRMVVMAGGGNNGGDGLVAARHLWNWGADVRVLAGRAKDELRDAPARQLATIESMGVPVSGPEGELEGADLIIDALLGYGAKGSPREPLAGMIRRANSARTPILAVDVPSGLDATTGAPGDPCVAARTTISFGFPKVGFLDPRARPLVGELYVADISLPRGAYAKYAGVQFSKESLVRVW
jgi:hydroxyethylthiazole kinase-like uncharacterized protein yjeF